MSEDIKRFDFNDKEAREKLVADLRQSMKEIQKEMDEQEEREKSDPPDRVRHEYNDIYWKPKVKEYWIEGDKYPAVHLSQGWYAGWSEEKIKEAMDCKDNPQTVDLNEMIIAHEMIPELIQELQKIYDDNKDIK